MAKKAAKQVSFDEQLVLFRYFLHELRLDSLGELGEKLNSAEFEGLTRAGAPIFASISSASAS